MSDWQAQFLNITWDQFRNLAYNLGQKIIHSGKRFDLIVSIARGGLTLSQLLSDQLTLPIAAFTVESYRNLKQEKLPHITYGLSTSLNNKKILLVDDVCDTGKTFIRGIDYLVECGAKKQDITTLSLHYKPHAHYRPDFFADQTEAWVIYPYEVKETILQLLPIWKKSGVSTKQIKERFATFAFPKEFVDQMEV